MFSKGSNLHYVSTCKTYLSSHFTKRIVRKFLFIVKGDKMIAIEDMLSF